jgi:predicted metalloprotease
MPIAIGGGIGTVVLLVLALLFGVDPSVILQGGQPPVDHDATPYTAPGEDPARDFVAVVLADTEDTWRELFRRMGREYRDPVLVLFSGSVQSACGIAGSAVGPFYCPADHRLYLDLHFFRALRERFRAPGDFAQAYVIAHEVGHHVQALLGLLEGRDGRGIPGARDNDASVRRELQADCFAGVWAHHANARDVIEEGAGRRGGDRRRPAPARGGAPGDARDVHTRDVRAARPLVQARHGVRRSAPVQPLRRRPPVASFGNALI